MSCDASSRARSINFSAGTISLIKSDAIRLFRSNDPARQQQVSRMFFPDLTQQKSRNDRRYESDSNFRVAELGFWHGQCEVA